MEVFDLFSGCGGFRLGFERAGFEFVGFCEIDKHASKLYKAYYKIEKEVYYNDARTIDTGKMPDFDVLVGGFPCQSFSIAGARLGFNDPRGSLIFEVARILRDKKPRYFLLENVKGLLSSGGGADFPKILELLADCGDYSIEWALLNSKDFGVAQNRERIYIAGFPRGKRPGQIFPLGIGEKPCHGRETAQKTVCETALCLTKSGQNNCNGSHIVIGTLRTHKNGQGFRVIKKNTCPTIPARARMDGSGQPMILLIPKTLVIQAFATGGGYDPHEIQVRRLTPLECFRLQGFPDDIVKKAYEIGISDAQLYKMAGNAVTVNVIHRLAEKIKELDKN